MRRPRLDKLVQERGLAESREKAQALILAGQVHVNGQLATKGGAAVANSVIVYLESDMGSVIQQANLIGNARFRFEGLQRTRYVVVAKAPGYRDATTRVDLTMMPNQSTMLTLYAETRDTPGAPAGLGSTEATVTLGTLLAPESAQREYAKGEEALTQNALPEAIAHFEKAVKIYPQYYQAYHSMGTLYMDQAKWPEAEKALKRSLEINDKYAPGYAALGALYNRKGSRPRRSRCSSAASNSSPGPGNRTSSWPWRCWRKTRRPKARRSAARPTSSSPRSRWCTSCSATSRCASAT